MEEILWALAFGAFGAILFMILAAVRKIRQKEKYAGGQGREASLSSVDGCIVVLVPMFMVGPFLALAIYFYLEDRSLVWLILSFLTVLFLVAGILLCYASMLKSGDKDLDSSEVLGDKPKGGLRTDTKAMISIMAAKKLEEQLDKEKEERERDRYESLYWQEAAREEMREDDYDYSDSSYDDDSDDADD